MQGKIKKSFRLLIFLMLFCSCPAMPLFCYFVGVALLFCCSVWVVLLFCWSLAFNRLKWFTLLFCLSCSDILQELCYYSTVQLFYWSYSAILLFYWSCSTILLFCWSLSFNRLKWFSLLFCLSCFAILQELFYYSAVLLKFFFIYQQIKMINKQSIMQ